jgi:8-oxo-dGTP diphosphatase
MAHIHTKPGQHDFTASAFIIRIDTLKPKVLLHMHKKLGVLLQPGGHIELNENPWQAVHHEIEEETGYHISQLKLLQPEIRIKELNEPSLAHPQPILISTHYIDSQGEHRHIEITYAFVTDEDPLNKPAVGESTLLEWLELSAINKLEPKIIRADTKQIINHIFENILNHWEAINPGEYQN